MKPLRPVAQTSLAAWCAIALPATPSRASIAHGSIDNFDTFNDNGSECDGIGIEMESCHGMDITCYPP